MSEASDHEPTPCPECAKTLRLLDAAYAAEESAQRKVDVLKELLTDTLVDLHLKDAE